MMLQKTKKIINFIKQKHLEIIFAQKISALKIENLQESKGFKTYKEYIIYSLNLINDQKVKIDGLIQLIDDRKINTNYDKISEELDTIFDPLVLKIFPILGVIEIQGLSVSEISRELQCHVIYKEE